MSAENAVIAELLHTDIRSVLATLDEREHQVIRLRFGLDDGQPARWTRSASCSGCPASGFAKSSGT